MWVRMSIRLAIVGVDLVQREWLEGGWRWMAEGAVELVGVGHRTLAMAKDTGDFFRGLAVSTFDDLRFGIAEGGAPQVITLDLAVECFRLIFW